MTFLIVGLDRRTLAPWHRTVEHARARSDDGGDHEIDAVGVGARDSGPCGACHVTLADVLIDRPARLLDAA